MRVILKNGTEVKVSREEAELLAKRKLKGSLEYQEICHEGEFARLYDLLEIAYIGI